MKIKYTHVGEIFYQILLLEGSWIGEGGIPIEDLLRHSHPSLLKEAEYQQERITYHSILRTPGVKLC